MLFVAADASFRRLTARHARDRGVARKADVLHEAHYGCWICGSRQPRVLQGTGFQMFEEKADLSSLSHCNCTQLQSIAVLIMCASVLASFWLTHSNASRYMKCS